MIRPPARAVVVVVLSCCPISHRASTFASAGRPRLWPLCDVSRRFAMDCNTAPTSTACFSRVSCATRCSAGPQLYGAPQRHEHHLQPPAGLQCKLRRRAHACAGPKAAPCGPNWRAGTHVSHRVAQPLRKLKLRALSVCGSRPVWPSPEGPGGKKRGAVRVMQVEVVGHGRSSQTVAKYKGSACYFAIFVCAARCCM